MLIEDDETPLDLTVTRSKFSDGYHFRFRFRTKKDLHEFADLLGDNQLKQVEYGKIKTVVWDRSASNSMNEFFE